MSVFVCVRARACAYTRVYDTHAHTRARVKVLTQPEAGWREMTASARLQGIAAATLRNRALAALTCTAFDCWLSSVAVAKVGVPVCVGVLTCMCMCMCMCVCVCVYVCMHACMFACLHAYVCMHVCMYVCMSTFMTSLVMVLTLVMVLGGRHAGADRH